MYTNTSPWHKPSWWLVTSWTRIIPKVHRNHIECAVTRSAIWQFKLEHRGAHSVFNASLSTSQSNSKMPSSFQTWIPMSSCPDSSHRQCHSRQQAHHDPSYHMPQTQPRCVMLVDHPSTPWSKLPLLQKQYKGVMYVDHHSTSWSKLPLLQKQPKGVLCL